MFFLITITHSLTTTFLLTFIHVHTLKSRLNARKKAQLGSANWEFSSTWSSCMASSNRFDLIFITYFSIRYKLYKLYKCWSNKCDSLFTQKYCFTLYGTCLLHLGRWQHWTTHRFKSSNAGCLKKTFAAILKIYIFSVNTVT